MCSCDLWLLYKMGWGVFPNGSQSNDSGRCACNWDLSAFWCATLLAFWPSARVYVWAYDRTLWAPGGPAHSYHSVPSSIGWPGRTFQQDLNRHALKILQWETGWLGSTSALPLVCLPVFSEWEHWLYTKSVDVGSRDYIACRSDVSFNTVSEIQMS